MQVQDDRPVRQPARQHALQMRPVAVRVYCVHVKEADECRRASGEHGGPSELPDRADGAELAIRRAYPAIVGCGQHDVQQPGRPPCLGRGAAGGRREDLFDPTVAEQRREPQQIALCAP